MITDKQVEAARIDLCERICAAIKAADDKSSVEADYMLDSNDCIRIVREQFAAEAAREPADYPNPGAHTPLRPAVTEQPPSADDAPQTALHPKTADLVQRFADALSEKLLAAQIKYGYGDGWAYADWSDECRSKLIEHLAKGDPRDVAAYCAFCWYHGWSTAAPPADARDADRLRHVLMEMSTTEADRLGLRLDDFSIDACRRVADRAMGGDQ